MNNEISEFRTCKVCREEKSISEFYSFNKSTCKQCCNERSSKWQAEHKLEFREIHKRYEQSTKGKVSYFKSAQRTRTGKPLTDQDDLTVEDLESLLEIQDYRCAGCGGKLTQWEHDHKVPVVMDGYLTKDNLQIVCRTCNNKKHAAHIDLWGYFVETGRYYFVDYPDKPEEVTSKKRNIFHHPKGDKSQPRL